MNVHMSKPRKVIYLLVGGLCLTLGLVGLIIPIIPGVLFLFAAIYLLSRGSQRIKRFTETNPQAMLMQKHMDQFGGVNAADRFRLAGWMALGATAQSLRLVGDVFSRAVSTVVRSVS